MWKSSIREVSLMDENTEVRRVEENLLGIIKPAVEKIDMHVAAVRQSQVWFFVSCSIRA